MSGSVIYCVLCWTEEHVQRPAVRKVDGDPLCLVHLKKEGFGETSGTPVNQLGQSASSKGPRRMCACGCGEPLPESYVSKLVYIRGHKTRQAVCATAVDAKKPSSKQSAQGKTMEPPLSTPPADESLAHGSQVAVKLKSGGQVLLRYVGDVFNLSRVDRLLLFFLADRIRAYAADGVVSDRLPRKNAGEEETVYMVPMTLSCLEDVYNNCATEMERAGLMAAWFRGDAHIKAAEESATSVPKEK